MKKIKKCFFVLMCVGILLVVVANIYAQWVNCSGPFPGTCTQGGCRNPQWADDCWLHNCMDVANNNLKCDYPKS